MKGSDWIYVILRLFPILSGLVQLNLIFVNRHFCRAIYIIEWTGGNTPMLFFMTLNCLIIRPNS